MEISGCGGVSNGAAQQWGLSFLLLLQAAMADVSLLCKTA